jgi:aspartate racemase
MRSESKAAYVEQIERLRRSGADSVILGCTEITMLIGPEDTELPVFDTTRIHAEAAMDFALGC